MVVWPVELIVEANGSSRVQQLPGSAKTYYNNYEIDGGTARLVRYSLLVVVLLDR